MFKSKLRANYLQSGKNVCVPCKSENVKVLFKKITIDCDVLSVPCKCKDCGEQWLDIFTFSSME